MENRLSETYLDLFRPINICILSKWINARAFVSVCELMQLSNNLYACVRVYISERSSV